VSNSQSFTLGEGSTISGPNEPFKRAADKEKKTAAEIEEEDAMRRLERLTEQLKNSSAMQEQVDDLLRLNRRQGVTNTDKLRVVLKAKRSQRCMDDSEDDIGAVFRAKRLRLEGEKAMEKRSCFKGLFDVNRSSSGTKSVVESGDAEAAFITVRPAKKKPGRSKKRKKKKKKKHVVEITL